MAANGSKAIRRSAANLLPRLSPLAWNGLVLVIFLVLVPGFLIASGSGYLASVAITALIFIILSVSLNHVTGAAGLLSLGHAAFYGIGAYTAALLAREGWPFLVTMPAAGIVAGFFGILIALPTMRLVSIYFAVATLGIGEMIYVTLLNWVGFTRGPMGIRSIPPIDLFGYEIDSAIGNYYVAAVGRAHRHLGHPSNDPFLLRKRPARDAGGRPVRRRDGNRRRPSQGRNLRRLVLFRGGLPGRCSPTRRITSAPILSASRNRS